MGPLWCTQTNFLFFSRSKQRHNKLWRSHSDSDLSDRQEPTGKPSSHSLGRSDPHNNNNASSPSLQHFLGVAVLQALGAEPQDSAKSTTVHTLDSNAHSNGVCDSPQKEGVKLDDDQHGDPLLPPLPRPWAATVVPEERVDNSPRVAVTVPVPVPHPPPSLHILPPTPELQRAHRGPPTQLCSALPKHNPAELSLDLPEQSSSEEISPLTMGSCDSDTQEKLSPLSPVISSPLLLSLGASDDNNNPSELQMGVAFDSRGEADGSSNHSTDSIDFFSAREKFLGLAHDGRTRTLFEQRATLSLALEENGEMVTEEEEEMSQTVDQVYTL